ncbi:hypothetical protein [Tsukamurella tyrosinosolvens]|uniref:hypothetical protein n=1 Tax=Tsukamurella tyrosinosolvens TaxID=57704 RepID=UPI003462C3B5
MAIKSGPVAVDRHGGQHCWSCGGMKFAPYVDDGADDLICWGCRAVNTTADPAPWPAAIAAPPLPPRRRGIVSAIGNLGGLIP